MVLSAAVHIGCMNKNLSAIRTLTASHKEPWTVEYGHDLLVPFYLIPDATVSGGGYRETLDFGPDAAAAYMVAGAVNAAGPMAAALQQLADLAEAVPGDAPEGVQMMARAILNAVDTVPEIIPQPEKGPFEL